MVLGRSSNKIIFFFILQYGLWYSLGGLWSLSSYCTRDGKPDVKIDYPKTIMQAKLLRNVVVKDYLDQHPVYTLTLFIAAFLYKQSFAQGSTAILTMISGSIFGFVPAWFLCSFLHAVGCCASYMNCRLTWRNIIDWLLSSRSRSKMRAQQNQVRQLIKSGRRPFFILRFFTGLRLFPLVSDYVINVISCQLGVPLWIHFTSSWIASVPYTFWILFIGSRLHNINTFPELLLSDDINLKRIVVSLFMLSILLLNPFTFLVKSVKDILREDRDGAAGNENNFRERAPPPRGGHPLDNLD